MIFFDALRIKTDINGNVIYKVIVFKLENNQLINIDYIFKDNFKYSKTYKGYIKQSYNIEHDIRCFLSNKFPNFLVNKIK
jgi:hypothetical protein